MIVRSGPHRRAMLLGAGLGLVLSATPAIARKKSKAVELPPATAGLIDNVNGLSVGEDGRLIRFTGLLIDKQGRVERRLNEGEKRPDSLLFRLDAKGQTLIPSFVDAHAEVIATGIAQMTLDLSDARSLEETLSKIAAYAKENSARKWILGRGWNPAHWGAEARMPTAQDLDAIVPGIPVWLESADGQVGWGNSLALKQAGITPTSKAPAGGRIIMAAGKPTGLLTGTAMALVGQIIPAPAPKDRDIALDKAQPLFLAAGIGTVADTGTSILDWQSFRRAGDRGALRLRIIGYADGISDMVTIAGPGPSPWLYNDHLRLAGVHFAIDGSLSTRTAWLKAPYADAPDEKGSPLIDSTRLRNQMSRAAMDDFQIALSADGDAAVDEALFAVEELAATYKGERRWRVIGASLIDPSDTARLAALGTLFTANPGMIATDGPALARRAGTQCSLLPLATLANGVGRLSLGSAAAGTIPSPFIAIAAAVSRTAAQGENSADITRTDANLRFEHAFAAATRGGAFALQGEKRLGALEPGQWADFLLIDRDISTASPSDIAGTRLNEHWLGGTRVWSGMRQAASPPATPDKPAAPQQ